MSASVLASEVVSSEIRLAVQVWQRAAIPGVACRPSVTDGPGVVAEGRVEVAGRPLWLG